LFSPYPFSQWQSADWHPIASCLSRLICFLQGKAFMKITSFTQDISAHDYAQEIKRLVSTLETNGYNTQGMDFSDIVAKKLGDAVAQDWRSRGIKIKNHSWEKKHDQGLRIKIYCFDKSLVPF
jgi:hypothetical protein